MAEIEFSRSVAIDLSQFVHVYLSVSLHLYEYTRLAVVLSISFHTLWYNIYLNKIATQSAYCELKIKKTEIGSDQVLMQDLL